MSEGGRQKINKTTKNETPDSPLLSHPTPSQLLATLPLRPLVTTLPSVFCVIYAVPWPPHRMGVQE